MSSLNEKGRILLTQKLNILNTGFIYNCIGHHRTNNNEIPTEIMETLCYYTDPYDIWIAMRVFVRLLSSNDMSTNTDNLNYKISADNKTINIINQDSENDENKENKFQFTYDHIYDTTSTSNDMFAQIGKPLIDRLLNGYNTSIISYGHKASGSQSILFGDYTFDPFEETHNSNQCIINDNGIYQKLIQYLFSSLESQQSNNKQLLNYGISLQHVYTYPEMETLTDALININDKSKQRTSDRIEVVKQLKIRPRKIFGDSTDTQIFIENARSIVVKNYSHMKDLYQIAHNNIFSSQLKYAKSNIYEAKSNYYLYKSSINQVISIDVNQYFNNGSLYQSNLKIIIPKYYFGKNNMYENVLSKSSSLPFSNYYKSDSVILRVKSDNVTHNSSHNKDPLFTVCNSLASDLMPRYKISYFTHLIKNVIGGNCCSLFLINCSLDNKYKMETMKCLKFGKLLKLIYNNPKLNVESIKQWAHAYNELKCKYDELFKEINENKKKKMEALQQSKSTTNSPILPIMNDSQPDEFRNDKAIMKQGYLNKEGGVIKSIKVRYFVLFKNRQLYYYDNVFSKEAIGIIDIKHDFKRIEQVNWLKDDDNSYSFHGFILSTKQREWKLGTGSINEVNQWIKVLKKAAGKKY